MGNSLKLLDLNFIFRLINVPALSPYSITVELSGGVFFVVHLSDLLCSAIGFECDAVVSIKSYGINYIDPFIPKQVIF